MLFVALCIVYPKTYQILSQKWKKTEIDRAGYSIRSGDRTLSATISQIWARSCTPPNNDWENKDALQHLHFDLRGGRGDVGPVTCTCAAQKSERWFGRIQKVYFWGEKVKKIRHASTGLHWDKRETPSATTTRKSTKFENGPHWWKLLEVSHSCCLFLWMSTCLPSVFHLSIYPSIHLSLSLSLSSNYLSVHLSICPSGDLSICLSIFLFFSGPLPVYFCGHYSIGPCAN